MENLFKKYPLILLAAGKSSRMGTPKGLVSFEGKPWLTHQLESISSIEINNVYVILGFHKEAYENVLPSQIHRIVNPNPEQGQLSSLQVGLSAINRKIEGVFILPLDVPCPNGDVWNALMKASNKTASVSIPTYEERGGHPVLLSPTFVETLLTVPFNNPNARLDKQIHLLPKNQVRKVPVSDKKIMFNINTPSDFRTVVTP